MKNGKENRSSFLVKVAITALIVFMPVAFATVLFDSHSMLRITMLRILAPAAMLVWLIGKISSGEEIKVSSLSAVSFVFVFILAVSVFFSPEPWQSFTGLYKFYSWGLSTVLCGFFIFIAATDEFEDDDWTFCAKAVFYVSAAVVFYGLLQIAGLDPFYGSASSFDRIFSTFGNPNFLASFLVMTFPVVLAVYLKTRKRDIAFIAYFAAFAANLAMTLSRAGWLAFCVSSVLFIFLVGGKIRKANIKKFTIVFLCIAVVFAVFGTVREPLSSLLSSGQEKSVVEQRADVMFDKNESSASNRIETWRAAFEMFKDNFLTGAGAGMTPYLISRYISPEYARNSGGEMVSNYAHNTFLQVAASSGIFAAAVYAALWLFAGYVLVSEIRKTEGEARLRSVAVFCSLAALFVYLQFHFFLSTLVLYFWILLAFAAQRKTGEYRLGKTAIWTAVYVFSAAAVFFVYFSARALAAEIYYSRGAEMKDRIEESLEKTVRLAPRNWFYRKQYVWFLRVKANNMRSGGEKEICIEKAMGQAKENYRLHPENVIAALDMGIAYLWNYKFSGDRKNLDKAEEALNDAYVKGPLMRDVLSNLTKVYLFKGDAENAGKYLSEIKMVCSNSGYWEELQKNVNILKEMNSRSRGINIEGNVTERR